MMDGAMLGKAGLAAMLAASLMLSGCGRRGALEPPPDASLTAPAATTTDGEPQAQPAPPARQKPDRPFALDFLL